MVFFQFSSSARTYFLALSHSTVFAASLNLFFVSCSDPDRIYDITVRSARGSCDQRRTQRLRSSRRGVWARAAQPVCLFCQLIATGCQGHVTSLLLHFPVRVQCVIVVREYVLFLIYDSD